MREMRQEKEKEKEEEKEREREKEKESESERETGSNVTLPCVTPYVVVIYSEIEK